MKKSSDICWGFFYFVLVLILVHCCPIQYPFFILSYLRHFYVSFNRLFYHTVVPTVLFEALLEAALW